jgi:hypothetical protein
VLKLTWMPTRTSHRLNSERPREWPEGLPHGEPLSMFMRSGKPCRRKVSVSTACTVALRMSGVARNTRL